MAATRASRYSGQKWRMVKDRYASDEMRGYLEREHRGAGSLSTGRGQRAARISAARHG